MRGLSLALLVAAVLAGCSHKQPDPQVATPKATVYTGGTSAAPNVQTTIVNPNGTTTTTGNTVYLPAGK